MHVQTLRFDGKVAVVTGASSGMGLATAEQLGMEGARVVAVGRRSEPLEIAAEKIRAAGVTSCSVAPSDHHCIAYR